MNKASTTESGKLKNNFKSSTVEVDDNYEVCIGCKSQTDVLRSTNIDHRYGYVIGLGQLCISCYKKNPF